MVDVDLERMTLRPERTVNIVFVGHVDAGKSTICGRVLVDLGRIDSRTLEKYKQQSADINRASWYLSWCMDINPEEREKGKTTEVVIASFDLKNTRVNILDAPGHKQFVQEMIDAAARADVGILIVSARQGEFEAGFSGGQTKEHLLLLKLGGVDRLIILINKMDDASWSKDRFDEIVTKLTKYTKKIFQTTTIIPISGLTGENIKARFDCGFYNGVSFLEYLDTIEIAERNGKGCMSVVEKVKTSGYTYLYVKADAGVFSRDSEVRILPSNTMDRIVSINTEADIEISNVTPGDTYRIRLKSGGDDVNVGFKLVALDNDEFASCTAMYAQLNVMEAPKAVTIGYTAIMHVSMQAVGCKVVELYTMEKKRVRVAREGERMIAKLVLDAPVVIACSADRKDRFSLRDEALTVAFGMIKKVIN